MAGGEVRGKRPGDEVMSAEPGPNRMAAVEELALLRQGIVDLVLSGSLIIALSFASGCRVREEMPQASIEFTKVPQVGEGGSEAVTRIEGRVRGARPEERIVLFAKSGDWWIQPLTDAPFTKIRPDSTWSNSTHLGTEYAALLVSPDYRPIPTMASLPVNGGAVRVVAVVKGLPAPLSIAKTLHFSGYDWKVRTGSSNRGGGISLYDPANAWTDKSGALHFRIAMDSGKWHCAEVNLTRSLGYGTYRFVVRDSSFLEPAAVLSMFTWDDEAAEQNHREFGVELARWGDPDNRNAQFIVQPYYVPANVARFMAPPGRIIYSVRWQRDSLLFTAMDEKAKARPHVIAAHSFTNGIPTPGNESVHMNLYLLSSSPMPLKSQTEVVIEKFEYLP